MASTASRASTRARASAAWRVDVGELPFERTLPLGESRLLLGQLGRGLGPVAIGILELAELGRDLLLARGRSRLGGEQLGLQVSEALLLGRGRFGALRQLLLALLERRLLGGDLCCARVDLRRAERQALRVGEAFLQPRLDVRELVAYLPLPGNRCRELGPDDLQLDFELAVRLADVLGHDYDVGFDRRRRRRWSAGLSRAASKRRDAVRPAPLPRRAAVRAGGGGRCRSPARSPAPALIAAAAIQNSNTVIRFSMAGPRMTMNIAGKMKITVGKSILIGDFIAFSSAAA